MSRHSKVLIVITLVSAYLIIGYPWVYIARNTAGTIVDEETGEPIAGAVVVAQWIAYVQKPGHGDHDYVLKVYETVTDFDGRYIFSGWGPMIRIPFTELDSLDPVISVFQNNYVPRTVANSQSRNSIVRISEWNRRKIRLKKQIRMDDAYASRLGVFATRFRFTDGGWKKYEKMTMKLVEAGISLKNKDVKEIHLIGIPSVNDFSEEFKRLYKGDRE